jgi:RimJ/RimL family protein N-acetyltransferase
MTYRPATIDDAELASDLMSASYVALPQDPLLTRYRWKHPRKDMKSGRFIGEIDGRPAAFLSWYHGPWEKLPDRHCEVEVWLHPAHLDRALLRTMFTWIGDRAVADGAGLLLAYCAEDEPEMLDSLSDLGYSRERIEKVWELDLRVQGPKLVEDARVEIDKMAAVGVELTTLDAWSDPDKMRMVYELDASTRQDIPTSLPILIEDFEDFVKRTKAPDRRSDRTWVALDDGRPVALSYLKFPPVRGTVWTGYTCTHVDHRGRGMARAVKLQTLAQAARLGVPHVRTDNDAENAPMLHINEALGYVRRPGFVEHHKRVTSK